MLAIITEEGKVYLGTQTFKKCFLKPFLEKSMYPRIKRNSVKPNPNPFSTPPLGVLMNTSFDYSSTEISEVL